MTCVKQLVVVLSFACCNDNSTVITNSVTRCLYISGVPGTGKTATVFEVMRYLKEAKSKDSIPDYKFIDINGMRLTQPHQAFVHIYKVNDC